MIVIPMAGLSSRFFKAGYQQPKYMLMAHGETLFAHAVNSFKAYFDSETFLFIVRDLYETKAFVTEQAQQLGINQFEIVELTQATRGQAETVTLGLEQVKHQNTPITIFNIDTFRPGFTFPTIQSQCDGYLEVFQGSGDNWSFAKPEQANSTKVVETAEKRPISDLCSTGLYYFANCQDYLDAYYHYANLPKEQWDQGELYIAPLYNYLIEQGRDIHYHLIQRDDVIFCGVPAEYDAFLSRD
ncbi:glycosyltransferase family 2 protein [Motilimonas eburnea]|uniref:glycosyltransferase family 2 protein n=1 Tax=Motilimonas eburnea TaxID=1737488 RepID=UPI001E297AC0|nr:glycosyltransferase family 2 protein [Motilimonas eburnea]MCE2572624.1 glycosyltransferase family 2 protein [Motilimonas eburnea]